MTSLRLPPALVALTPGDLEPAGARALLARLERAVAAGLRGLVVRERALSDRATLELGRSARAILGSSGWLAIHDRAHLAPACAADAVHVGFRSLAPSAVRAIVDGCIAVGFSAHEGDGAAECDGSDYVFLGPVHATPKNGLERAPLGFDGLARATRAIGLPAWAIGGLSARDAAHARSAGARGIAVRRGVLGADDPAAAARAYVAAWESAA